MKDTDSRILKIESSSTKRWRRSSNRTCNKFSRPVPPKPSRAPLLADDGEVAKELKREGWYAWASDYASVIFRIERVRAKSGKLK